MYCVHNSTKCLHSTCTVRTKMNLVNPKRVNGFIPPDMWVIYGRNCFTRSENKSCCHIFNRYKPINEEHINVKFEYSWAYSSNILQASFKCIPPLDVSYWIILRLMIDHLNKQTKRAHSLIRKLAQIKRILRFAGSSIRNRTSLLQSLHPPQPELVSAWIG